MTVRARCVVRPVTLPISVADVKTNLEIEHDLHDSMLERMIRSALTKIERSVGQAFEPQTWEIAYDVFPSNEIELPFGPVMGVVSVIYTDADGNPITIDSADYEVDPSIPGWVLPSTSWPTAMETINAVKVRWIAGEELGAPDDIKHAIHLLVGHYYANREAAVAGSKVELPLGVESHIASYRLIYI